MNNLLEELQNSHAKLREKKPLVLCLTNFVTVDFMANALLALGAAPLMTEDLDELDELLSLCDALNLNIGTLNPSFSELALSAAELAKKKQKPLILDPVGAGASQIRTKLAKTLAFFAQIIRGNASEILALSMNDAQTKGVETTHSVSQAAQAAENFALEEDKIVVVSGPIDLISNGYDKTLLPYGSPLMPLVTGMGCVLSAIIAAFAAIEPNPYKAALLAVAYFGLCGQLVHKLTQKPGSFRQLFVDCLYQPDWEAFGQFIELQRGVFSEHAI